MPLTPRERVLAVLAHETPDRVPIFIGADLTTGILSQAYLNLKTYLGLEPTIEAYLYDWPELGAPRMEEVVLERLHSDVRGIQDRFPASTYQRNRGRPPGSPYWDDWGVGQTEIAPDFFYPSIHPLAQAQTPEDIVSYPHWPDMDDPSRYAHLSAEASQLARDNYYAIVAAPWLIAPLERACQLQGMETFLVNLVERPDFAQALLEKIKSVCLTHLGHFLAALGENVDILILGDDLGAQNGPLISPRLYRRILKPIHAEIIAFAKAHSPAKIFFHSDGDVSAFLDDFVEIGVDILNPIQTSAGQMGNLGDLKRRYGRNLIFCGGIDTQTVLSAGQPNEVRQEVKRVIEILGENGGYLLAAVHSITNEVPPQNIMAMIEAALEFGRYG
ncbi:uroporphyrinogen decarboxylase family protein [Thermanaerothrix sp.]|jgi:uroporphyrinogen decarboxylase|uniref:uroporphyrinogen decarboxylase family protein n=1 Tax=Thermanaerothrix sp. TaxID=2972675 RepID=UPI002ADDB433|nr:uroporphyrinogen decarboxylase family protein [Thermanaerothrix sp.]